MTFCSSADVAPCLPLGLSRPRTEGAPRLLHRQQQPLLCLAPLPRLGPPRPGQTRPGPCVGSRPSRQPARLPRGLLSAAAGSFSCSADITGAASLQAPLRNNSASSPRPSPALLRPSGRRCRPAAVASGGGGGGRGGARLGLAAEAEAKPPSPLAGLGEVPQQQPRGHRREARSGSSTSALATSRSRRRLWRSRSGTRGRGGPLPRWAPARQGGTPC